MRTTPLPEFQSEALLPGLDFARILSRLQAHARDLGTDLHNGHGRSVWVQRQQGEYGARKLGRGSLIYARAHRPEWLAAMQDAIASLIRDDVDSGGEIPIWNTDGDQRPPVNFSCAEVLSVTRLSADFLRLRLAGADLDRLGQDDSIHFRLVQPARDQGTPIWPHVGDRGQTVWPQGERALRRPVYTTRHIDARAGWLETDIFLHPGGRTSAWALAARPGDPVGLMGQSGGGVPLGERLILAGDETAYPAIARFLQTRAGTARGEVWLLGKSADYPLPRPAGFAFRHRPDGYGELARMMTRATHGVADSLWIGGERSAIEPLRLLLAHEDPAITLSSHVSAFWTA